MKTTKPNPILKLPTQEDLDWEAYMELLAKNNPASSLIQRTRKVIPHTKLLCQTHNFHYNPAVYPA